MLTRESVFLDGSLGGEAQAESWLVVSLDQSGPGNRAHAHALSLSFFVCVWIQLSPTEQHSEI